MNKISVRDIIAVVLAVLIIALIMDSKSFYQKEKFSCGGCGGPSYIHNPWRITYDCDMVKYA